MVNLVSVIMDASSYNQEQLSPEGYGHKGEDLVDPKISEEEPLLLSDLPVINTDDIGQSVKAMVPSIVEDDEQDLANFPANSAQSTGIPDNIFSTDLPVIHDDHLRPDCKTPESERDKAYLIPLSVNEINSTVASEDGSPPNHSCPSVSSTEFTPKVKECNEVILQILHSDAHTRDLPELSVKSEPSDLMPCLPDSGTPAVKVLPVGANVLGSTVTAVELDALGSTSVQTLPQAQVDESPINTVEQQHVAALDGGSGQAIDSAMAMPLKSGELSPRKKSKSEAEGEAFTKSRTGVIKIQNDGQMVIVCPKPLKRSEHALHRGMTQKWANMDHETLPKKVKTSVITISRDKVKTVQKRYGREKTPGEKDCTIQNTGSKPVSQQVNSSNTPGENNEVRVTYEKRRRKPPKRYLEESGEVTKTGRPRKSGARHETRVRSWTDEESGNEDVEGDEMGNNTEGMGECSRKPLHQQKEGRKQKTTKKVKPHTDSEEEIDKVKDTDVKDCQNIERLDTFACASDKPSSNIENRVTKRPRGRPRKVCKSVKSNLSKKHNPCPVRNSVPGTRKRGRPRKIKKEVVDLPYVEDDDSTDINEYDETIENLKQESDEEESSTKGDNIEISMDDEKPNDLKEEIKKAYGGAESEGEEYDFKHVLDTVKLSDAYVSEQVDKGRRGKRKEGVEGKKVGRPKKNMSQGERIVNKLRKQMAKKNLKPTPMTSILLYCEKCDMDYTASSDKGKHKECGSTPSKVQCEICRLYFRSKKSAHNHKTMRHSVSQSVSCVCGKLFNRKSEAKAHRPTCLKFQIFHGRAKASKGPYTCEICGETFKTIKTYTRHLKAEHNRVNDSSSYICKVCGKEFIRVTSLLNHEKYVHSSPSIQCPFCEKKVKNKVSLLYHVQTHREISASYGNEEDIESVENKFCLNTVDIKPVVSGESSLDQGNILVTFTEAMLKQESKFKYRCPLCDHQYNTARQMKGHILQIHGMVSRRSKNADDEGNVDLRQSVYLNPRYLCQLCGKQFYQKNSYNDHVAIHNGKVTETCKECGRQFITKTAYQRHMRISHFVYSDGTKVVTPPQKQQVTCSICGAKLYKSALRKHMDKHNGVYRFTCSVCGKKCRSHYDLQNHERTHTGEQPYSCDICGRKFSDRANLRHHEKRIHNLKTPKERNIRVVGFHSM